MDRNGFSGTQLNPKMDGNKIATAALQDLSEFSTAYSAAGDYPSLDAFRYQLEQKASTDPSKSPLSALYILATSLFGRPSNLKEAIDWILRVTGKDGGGGQNGTQTLTKEVNKLLKKVKGVDSGLGLDIDKVKDALANGELLTKLAEGLQQFIGYDGGTIKYATNGIGMSNDPLERIKDGILVFVYAMVQSLKTYVTNGEADTAMKTIRNGKVDFNKTVEKELKLTPKSGSDFPKVLDVLKKVTDLQGNDISTLAGAFKTYLGNVFDKVAEDNYVQQAQISMSNEVKQLVTDLKSHFENVVDALKTANANQPINFGQRELKQHIDKIYNGSDGTFKKLYDAVNPKKPQIRDAKAKDLVYAVYISTSSSLSQLQKGYKSYYQAATWSGDTESQKKCGKIFMACLPLIFTNLGYLFWNCRSQGPWNGLKLDGSVKPSNGIKQTDLKNFMDLMAFSAHWLSGGKNGENIATSALGGFTEFSTAANGSSPTYAQFLKNLKEATEYLKDSNTNPLSALFYCSTVYFQGCHIKNASQITRPPSSIREMLYWLSGLQFAPGYSDFEKHVSSVVKTDFQVAISGSSNRNDKLTADQVTEYLLTTCLYSPTIFCNIQEPGISNHTDEPWLHSLYSNSEFNFTYPSSGTALLYTISNYVYALQFQFQFLYKQCEFDYENGCGWWLCKFGSNVFPKDDTTVPSSFCGSVDAASGKHSGNTCGLPSGTPSPLQAFLTDNLKGFRRDTSDPYSHLAECTVGSMCHVPMGFKVNDLRGLATGGHLMMALKFFCGKSNTPLPKLCHTLSCVTKRTPRTLSDVFGLTFHLTGQMFHKARSKDSEIMGDLNSALTNLISKIPDTIKHLFFDVTSDLKKMGSRFFDLSLHCHKVETGGTKQRTGTDYCNHHTRGNDKAADLASLSGCTSGNTCGKYFEPLTVSSGATFANDFASTYLTWALYLTDDIYESLQGFLDRFNSLKCTGCKNTPPCTSHTPGQHVYQCQCPSIVQCADALTAFYEYGFHFQDAFWLKGRNYTGGKWHHNSNKRTCANFHSQL
ncbi:uncharacterized protein BcabD6B2_07910 [Babesia caballi]|uniref:Uncharacterized protein n=1 Tax=Babesia caballi TaxID=5871 RepID=A0AAV4LNE9_BABCB|nr:hypothetical protein, conserved [Babesia caballi]